jgi:hypothetical protein
MQYTNEQLKRTLAKMLPDQLSAHIHRDGTFYQLEWTNGRVATCPVRDTELLHLCWLVEETLSSEQCNNIELKLLHGVMATDDIYKRCWHATWQQRTIALAKTLGVEIE